MRNNYYSLYEMTKQVIQYGRDWSEVYMDWVNDKDRYLAGTPELETWVQQMMRYQRNKQDKP